MHVRPPFVVNEILPQVECAFAIASLDRRANSPRLSLERSELARRLEEPSAARTRRLSLAQRELALSLVQRLTSPFCSEEKEKNSQKENKRINLSPSPAE